RIVTLPPLPPRPLDGHKGLFGRVLIVGGNDAMIGAPVLAGTAALRMGAGLVQIALPQEILPAALSITPELIGLSLGGSSAALVEAAEKADAVVIGPGMGQSSQAKSRLERLIKLKKSMLIDADGLNLLAAGKTWPKSFKASAILTPHPGEMKRLAKLFKKNEVPADDDGRIEIATLAAKTFGQTIVLKGNRTVVTDGEKVYLNRTGDSSLSKAGTGDVLSGIIGTLLSQKMDHFEAACAGVWLHGRAGEIAGKKFGRRSVLARDVIDSLPDAIREYEL
ncbi:MAG TPA: NAD(P)H-hydrate dehydratase, partial [Tepidisphaeraceae bacterium]|nr:NAD(P)H-hydrate dehydratase [Tepidisphaeraceae bacterium]